MLTAIAGGQLVGLGAASTAGSVPGKPTTVKAVPHNVSAKVTWVAPATNGTPVTTYTVTSSPTTQTCTTSLLSCTVPNLQDGKSYTFTVTAKNGAGTGPASTPSTGVIPTSVPGKPTITKVTAEYTSAVGVKVQWTAPPDNGTPISTYTVVSSPTARTCTATTTTTCTVTHLIYGTPYTFTVRATNGRGTGPPSTPSSSVTPAVPPRAAPTIASVTPGNKLINVNWTPVPSSTDGGAVITGYYVAATNGKTIEDTFTVKATATSATVKTHLTNGTSYEVEVAAENAAGKGAVATSAPVTPGAVPGQPALVGMYAGDQSALVIWRAASTNGTRSPDTP